jgi:hypothetical protein
MLNLKDALLTQSGNLPNGAAATLTTGLNLQLGTHGETDWHGEFEIDAPALSTTELANASTMTYDVVVSANANLSSPTLLYGSVLVQTGAGGTGAAAGTARFRTPLSIPLTSGGAAQPYIGIRATNSSTGNPSAKTFSLTPVF